MDAVPAPRTRAVAASCGRASQRPRCHAAMSLLLHLAECVFVSHATSSFFDESSSTLTAASMFELRRLLLLAVTALAILPQIVSAGPPKSLISRAGQGIIDLDTQSFTDVVTNGQADRKDYSLTILLTALNSPGVDCAPCKLFQPEYEAIATAWKNKEGKRWSEGKSANYFAIVNFARGRDVFGQLGLQHAPVVMFLPAGAPMSKMISYDYNENGFGADKFAGWVAEVTGQSTGYRKPFPWKTVLTFVGTAALIGSLCLFAVTKFNAALEASGGPPGQSIGLKTFLTWLIQLGSLSIITIMCSGYMWNKIRGAQYLNVSQNGKIEYFAGGFSNQLGVETQIVSGIYGILAFSVVALTLLVPTQRDPVKQRAGVYVWSMIFLAGVSVLFAVFRIKNPSYPFRLFL